MQDFQLPDQNGQIHTLKQYLGHWVILYFYPKDDTPGCTKEACNFRDSLPKFTKHNVVILGVSKDSVISHQRFAEKYSLNFPILSDEKLDTIKAFGAWGPKKFMSKEYFGVLRTTVLISPEGEIKKVYKNVNPLSHAEEILKDLLVYT